MTWIADSIQNNMATDQEVSKDRQRLRGTPLGTMALHLLSHNSQQPQDKPTRDLSHLMTREQQLYHFRVSVPT